MTRTALLMDSITADVDDLAVLYELAARQTSGHAYSKLIGAIRTLQAELSIKRDELARACAGWFEVGV